MDDLLERFPTLDHYELLGVSRDADAATLQSAWRMLQRRYDPTYAAPNERARFESLRRALDAAYAVLSDPLERYRYDHGQGHDAARPPTRSLSDFTWVAASEPDAEVRRPSGPAARRSSPEVPAAADNGDPRVAQLQGDVQTLLLEVERLAVALQLTLAQVLEPDAARTDSMLAAVQTLSATRATLASLQARKEEAAGRWEQAAALWQRAARQRPDDPTLLMKASDALRRGTADLDGAEALARKALEIDPDLAEAHAALAVIAARRGRQVPGAR